MDDTGRRLAGVLWIGGAQWAGKTSVARILSDRHGLQLYQYDYHDSRGHQERADRQPDRFPAKHAASTRSAEEHRLLRTPEEMAQEDMAIFEERFAMTLDDIAACPEEPPLVAEGWGLRPRLVASVVDAPRRAIFLVPTDDFRDRQLRTMPRAAAVSAATRDPERAQRNRVERDRLLARDVLDSASELGLRTVLVDGTRTVDGVAALVEDHFRPFLPPSRPSFDEHSRRFLEQTRQGDHQAALRSALAARECFPERASTTWLWVAAALARTGRIEEALTTVEDAAGRDLAWRLAMFRSPALEALRPDTRFRAALDLSRRRAAAQAAHPLVRTWAPASADGAPPLLLCLHGANASAEQFADLAPALAEAGWLVACGQSSQPAAPGRFCWDDPERADADVDTCLARAGAHDPRRVAIVGFSQGAGVAIRAALRGRAPLGFIGLAAALSPPERAVVEELAGGAAPVRGGMWSGDRDPWLETAERVHAALGSRHDVWFETLPGRGHTLSWQIRALLPEILGRMLRA